ncbi:MAG: chemotaxis protein CheX [Polyangiaceae bacterium]
MSADVNSRAVHVTDIVNSFTRAFLGVEAEPIRDGRGLPTGRRLAACVSVRGAWNGAVVLLCSRSLAETAAAAMFGIAGGKVADADARDALGEMTNIIGGNLKCAVATLDEEPGQLSLPFVTDGTLNVARVAARSIVRFRVLGELLEVGILDSDPPAGDMA